MGGSTAQKKRNERVGNGTKGKKSEGLGNNYNKRRGENGASEGIGSGASTKENA